MINIQDFLRNTQVFRKFEVDDLQFVEVVCRVDDDSMENQWWHNNFFSYSIAGKLLVKTTRGEYVQGVGDCVFAKKGSVVSAEHLEATDFCELRIFVPDEFIRSVFQKYQLPALVPRPDTTDTLIPLPESDVLDTYFHSMLSYFKQPVAPSESLLKIKFEELLVSIISNNLSEPLNNFLRGLCLSGKSSIKGVMEANFFCNLTLEEFARLCCRSLSAFKREFKEIFHTTPGKWLLEKRLEYSHYLLKTTDMSIDEICTLSGFENRSHFNRTFKEQFNISPGKLGRKMREHA
ncbi:MAG TPA: AraC family transcriptional regulator [Cyclobacteriaceae bacterium]|jgi:AraC-like DNA-binding protein